MPSPTRQRSSSSAPSPRVSEAPRYASGTLPSGFSPRLELSPDELTAFDQQGFHIHEPLFSAAEVDEIRAACEQVAQRSYPSGSPPDVRMWEPEFAATAVCKIDNSWKSHPTIQAAVTSDRIGRIAAQLIGAYGIRLWHDQYLRKPGNGGGIVSWHQDWMYWQAIDRCRTVTCWIALSDVTVDMGPMVFLAGSHQDGLQQVHQPGDWTGDRLPPPPVATPYPRVPVLVRAGQVSFHHGNTLHASDANTSQRDRFSLVSHVMAADCCYRSGPERGHMCITQMLAQPGSPQPGERFCGPQFPWVWRAS